MRTEEERDIRNADKKSLATLLDFAVNNDIEEEEKKEESPIKKKMEEEKEGDENS